MQMCEALEECDWCPELSPVSAGPRLSSHWSRMFLMVPSWTLIGGGWLNILKKLLTSPHLHSYSLQLSRLICNTLQNANYIEIISSSGNFIQRCLPAALQHCSMQVTAVDIFQMKRQTTILQKVPLYYLFFFSNKVDSWFITISFMLTY